MALRLGDEFPDFAAETSDGPIASFHEWMGQSWAILFSHPADFTPVCTSELARAAALAPEFARRDVKLAALSCDSVDSHRRWIADIREFGERQQKAAGRKEAGDSSGLSGEGFPFPIIADEERELIKKLGMEDLDEKNADGIPLAARAARPLYFHPFIPLTLQVFIVGPDKKLKLSILYPATTGRNFDEILRVVDSLQLTARRPLATPADWQPGASCMVQPTLSAEAAAAAFPRHSTVQLPSGRAYLRMTDEYGKDGAKEK
ncbi:Peroxiredoxin-6 [Aphelenchoides fujianensis]|nr:Peroxiredoxin-6 [Aphelenchoides fujianensis]